MMQQPVPILFFYPFNKSMTGGPRTILNLLRMLDPRRVRPVLVSQQESPLTAEARALGVAVEVVPLPGILDVYEERALGYSLKDKALSGWALLSYGQQIAQVARAYGAQGIWARGIKAVLMVGWAARRLRLPLVWDIGMEKASVGWVRLLHVAGLLLATRVVTQARAQAQEILGARLQRRFASKFETIYPGLEAVHVEALGQAAARRRAAAPQARLLCVGTIQPRKNQLLLLRSLRALAARHPEVRVTFAGPVGEEAYAARLHTFVREQALEPHVRFLGWCDDVPGLLAESTALVICSNNEGVPHVVREAMYAEVPVVATRVGGLPEAVMDGETGYLIPPDDAQRLAACLARLLDDPAAGRRMGVAGRRLAEQRFAAAAWAAAYEQLLVDLSTTGPPQRSGDPVFSFL